MIRNVICIKTFSWVLTDTSGSSTVSPFIVKDKRYIIEARDSYASIYNYGDNKYLGIFILDIDDYFMDISLLRNSRIDEILSDE